ncbi:glycoside hydrolase [Streptomyces sp. NPDC088755]|uniref:glycoside hydrolase n=1 Tax=Streptomyces sp. NPDC088755 TaxID=3365888 RepID=UPI0037F84058
MIRRRTLLAGAGAGVLASTFATGTARAASTVAVDPSVNWGIWEGWGTSLSWWARALGDRDDLADIFFTTKWVTYDGKSLPGLGLNIARYNAGASSWNQTASGDRMVVSGSIQPWKRIEGFWQDWTSEDPTSSAWNWNADANQRAMLLKATQRGAISELFAKSPMWWMCKNHNPSGAAGVHQDNIQSWNYRPYASYLAAVALRAKENWGVDFVSVEPFNEPSAEYWYAQNKQEGCFMSHGVQKQILPYLRGELDKRGLTATKIAAADETSMTAAVATWNAYDALTRSLVDRVNVHGYEGGQAPRAQLYTKAVTESGKGLWNSETGNGDGGGLSLALTILADFQELHQTAWVYWQVMDNNPSWGMIDYTPGTGYGVTPDTPAVAGSVRNKYYLMAQFSRHIRPGMKIIKTDDPLTVAALDETNHKLVIVAANNGSTLKNVTFDLSRFSAVAGRPDGVVLRWNTGAGDAYTQRSTALNGKSVTIPVNAKCLQTVEIEGVVV